MKNNAFTLLLSGQRLLLLLLLACVSSACNRRPDSEWQSSYKTAVVGDWEEVAGTRETLHFNSDGTLIMVSPSEQHSCTYEFPDPKHILLNCAAAQAPHQGQTYGFALANDKLMITDALSTGTYKRTSQGP